MSYGSGTYGVSVYGDGSEATITNLGFEDGTNGLALPWGVDDFVAAATEWAVFSDAGRAYEDFEVDWSNFPNDMTIGATIAATFTGASTVETFSVGWSTDGYLLITFADQVAAFASGNFFEGFGSGGWSNAAYLTSYNEAPWLFQGFLLADGAEVETFEAQWSTNQSYLFAYAGPELSAASFANVRALAFENFENVKAAQSYSANATTDALGTTAHGLALNYRVILASPVAGTMPAPLAPTIAYYVQNVPDANNFKVAQTASAGAAIDITAVGSGLLVWTAPYEHWVSIMATV